MENFQVLFLIIFLQKCDVGRGPNIFSIAKSPPFMMENWYPSAFPVVQVHSTRLFYLMQHKPGCKKIHELLKITIVSRIPDHKEMNGLLPSHRQILMNTSSAQFS